MSRSTIPRLVTLSLTLICAAAGGASGPSQASASSPPVAAGTEGLHECRLLRQPDIDRDRIVFMYGGDLWTVARAGGVASRLTSHDGEEQFPKFSPDGRSVAFTGEYDGNVDLYTIPAEGGEPHRLTWHPDKDQVAEWYPDGRSILFRSRRASAILRYDRFFRVAADGGFPEMLPPPTGGYASFSPDGSQIAYVDPSYDNRTWKHYRGGMAPDIWLYDFAANRSERLTDWPGPDEWPMWVGRTIYYASDRGGRTVNLWAYDLDRKTHRQVTTFTDADVRWPSAGPDAIVFEKAGALWVMDLPSETAAPIRVLVPDDRPATRAEYRNVAKWIGGWGLSPSAKRAVIEARGDIFTVPAEKGDARNLTRSPGWRERDPAWSPDGKWIAYLSDESGESEVHVIPGDGSGPDRQVTKGGPGYRYAPRWSPDSKKIAFSDGALALSWCDVASGAITRVDKSDHEEIHDYTWSADSRFLAYSKMGANQSHSVMIYALDDGRVTPVTGAMTDDFSPAFDPEGRWIYFVSRRTIDLTAFAFEMGLRGGDTDKIYAATLRPGLLSPVPPQSDEETGPAAKEEAVGKVKGDGGKAKGTKGKAEGSEAAPAPWKVDLAGIETRQTELPIPAGRYDGLRVFKGKILYLALAMIDPESDSAPSATLHLYDLDAREDKTILAGIDSVYDASADGGKVLYKAKETFGIIDAAPGKKIGDGAIKTDGLMATVDPPREWAQMFNEAWRLERDFYYDPGMGGLDWKAIGDRYRALLPYLADRHDLNYIIGEMIAELSTSHTYVGGGDTPDLPKVAAGLLGADYDLDPRSGLYRFARIYRARDWSSPVAAPLGEPGIDVREGDYLLAVNDRPVRSPQNVYAAFVGTADTQTRITVGSGPDDRKPRTFTVKPVARETTLRYTAWVQANRDKVARATGGRIAYIHVPDTATRGMFEFAKQYYPQDDKQGIIVDERFNSGGFVPDQMVERLARRTWSYWGTRDGLPERTPATAIDGPKCMLINQYAGSGGDAFPYYFRLVGAGPLIGKRTWGGLVGYSHLLPLVDGGIVTMPDVGVFDLAGRWAVENHGVDPDIEVDNPPDALVAGHDPQLERAIEWTLDQLERHPVTRPPRPPYKVQE
ncbi:MAG TPA: PDZ domain-containing protein [Candidatus Polarisedimenticolia bacterium]|nr:PDZ domain-containing protein [Candidatus Polarisedimenticolia bacterium]